MSQPTTAVPAPGNVSQLPTRAGTVQGGGVQPGGLKLPNPLDIILGNAGGLAGGLTGLAGDLRGGLTNAAEDAANLGAGLASGIREFLDSIF
jgi:hypothetical protein